MQAKPLLSINIADGHVKDLVHKLRIEAVLQKGGNSSDISSGPATASELLAVKMERCCHLCENYHPSEKVQQSHYVHIHARRNLGRKKKPKPQFPTADAQERFRAVDDFKCGLWHLDDKGVCHLWNDRSSEARTMDGHVIGVPEGQCPTQISNSAVTPMQICHAGGYLAGTNPLPAKTLVDNKTAVALFESGERPVVSSLKFPDALLPDGPHRSSSNEYFTKFHTTATCVSRIDQSVSGFRNQTALPLASVEECCFACEDSSICKAWTYDRHKGICYVFNKTVLHITAFYQHAPGFVGGLVTERFCDMSPTALQAEGSFVLPNTDIKGWDIILPGLDQGFFAYSARHCCVMVAAMDEYRLHGWTYDASWQRCYPKVSRVAGTALVDPSRQLTSGILLQEVPKCEKDKCIVSNTVDPTHAAESKPEPKKKAEADAQPPATVAFCDGTLDAATGRCSQSRQKQRGYDCRDCMHCHDACQFFLTNAEQGYRFNKDEVCQDYLSEWGACGNTPAHKENGLDCRGCRIREELYNGDCSHLCQYPERCSTWFSSDFKCVPKFVYGFIIADCNWCFWPTDPLGFSVE